MPPTINSDMVIRYLVPRLPSLRPAERESLTRTYLEALREPAFTIAQLWDMGIDPGILALIRLADGGGRVLYPTFQFRTDTNEGNWHLIPVVLEVNALMREASERRQEPADYHLFTWTWWNTPHLHAPPVREPDRRPCAPLGAVQDSALMHLARSGV